MNFNVKYKKLEMEAKSLLSFRKSFWNRVSKAVERSIITNILDQTQADGSAIKKNAPSTIERKRARIKQARKRKAGTENRPKTNKEKKPKENKSSGKTGSRSQIRSLVDQPSSHRFIQRGGGSYNALGYLQTVGVRNFVGVRIGFSNEETKRTALMVQGMGYTGWFGLSETVKKAISVLYLKEIEKTLERIANKNNRKKPK